MSLPNGTGSSNPYDGKDSQEIGSEVVEKSLLDIGSKLEDDPDEEMSMYVDVDGVPLIDEFVGIVTAAAKLNHKYGSQLCAGPHFITNRPDEFLEGMPDEFRDTMVDADELAEIYDNCKLDTIPDSQPDGTEGFIKNLESLTEDIDGAVVRDHGLETDEERVDYFESLLDTIESVAPEVLNNSLNVVYVRKEDTDMTDDELELFAMIGAYVLGHKGARCGVWDGDVVWVDDVQMFAERNGLSATEFMENSWSKKEAEYELEAVGTGE